MNTPRNVRPSWISVKVDGKERLATGPRSLDGKMQADLFIRDKGSVLYAGAVFCYTRNGQAVIDIYDENDKVIHTVTRPLYDVHS
jgi:5-methylcytosine-specific restriction endonuclease McrA